FPASEIMTVIYESFFWRPKMRGKRDSKFFDNINHVFICLAAATIQHCLKELKTGEATEAIEFKYDTAAGKYNSNVKSMNADILQLHSIIFKTHGVYIMRR
ncbi:hypothetical protein L211DRAFT_785253, partial [Terfezia boudieri ATCC MYA-4762]